MTKTAKNFLIIFCSCCFVFFCVSLVLSAVERTQRNELYKELDLFADSISYIQQQYVEETKPKDLIYGAISGMLGGLDPHSQFLTPQEYEDLKIDTEGKFGGIGVEITLKDNLITVITPMEGTPAWNAGLKPNDRIVKIDATVIKNFTLNQAVKKLRGKPGTEVQIVAWREKENKLYTFKIKRTMIDVKDIKDVKILEDGIGYLKLVEFREDTPRDLDRTLAELKAKGIKSLIFDLRNNPGGLLVRAVDVTERFLPRGALIVAVKSRDPKDNEEYKSNFGSGETRLPMVLLVNEGSASGSEIMAGALQDHRRATVIGTLTFGKGSIQTVLPLRDGSALKLTTSRYYTPKGRVIHNQGITPDIVVQMPSDESGEPKLREKRLEEIFKGVEENKTPEPAEATEVKNKAEGDTQLLRAIELLKSSADPGRGKTL